MTSRYGCEYCTFNKYNDSADTIILGGNSAVTIMNESTIENNIYQYNAKVIAYINASHTVQGLIHFNYCPMCGRKLEEE